MENDLELRAIEKLLGHKFVVPKYQRGFRWGELQVLDLLNDIKESMDNQKESMDNQESSYCLQPIVVRENNKGEYILIDGQQRVTTIYLLLVFLEKVAEANYGESDKYDIEYETREHSKEFLEKISNIEKKDDENIDFYCISSAYLTIKKWFSDATNENFNRGKFLDYLRKNVKIIWYEVNDNEEEVKVFTRLNSGKTPLSNGELIKALLLNGMNENEKYSWATIWDNIENELNNEKLWCFLTNESKKSEKYINKIELIFEVLSNFGEYKTDKNKFKTKDKYYLYYIFNEYLNLKEEKNSRDNKEKILKDVKDVFRIFKEWYSDVWLYNIIGFVLVCGIKKLNGSNGLISLWKGSNKDKFKDEIDESIKNHFSKDTLNSLEYENKKIKAVLLLHNIVTLGSENKFRFDKYKGDDWDIEHIRSQTDDIIKFIDGATIENLKKLKEEEEKLKGERESVFGGIDLIITDKNSLKNIKEKLEKNGESLKFLIDKLEEEENEKEFIKDSLGNLTLLDSNTNRGYKNAIFMDKRARIIENIKWGKFTPVATSNVFSKLYTDDAKEMTKWSVCDAKNYFDDIAEKLEKYIEKEEDNSNE